MDLVWHESEGSIRPKELELNISPTTVYFRKNIREVTKENEDGTSYTSFIYDEATLPKSEYASFLAAENANNIADIENAVCEESITTNERLDDIENAICELSEAMM